MYSIDKAKEKGVYSAFVSTREPNDRGNYKLEFVGNFEKNPERITSQDQKITNQWTRQSLKHSYTFPAQISNQEIMIRSTEGECTLSIIDPFGQPIQNTYKLNSPGLKNAVFECKTPGNYKITVETTNPNGGEYDLLFFGKFGQITSQNLKAAAPGGITKTKTNEQNKGETPVISNVEEVVIRGQVRNQANAENLRVVYYDLATNQQIGEVPVATNGTYQFTLPRGQRYSLQLVGDGEFVASSQNIDLRDTRVVKGSKTVMNKTYTVREVVTMPIEAGSTITLNNLFFATGKSTLLPESFNELNRLSELMAVNPSMKVEIAGHTDNVGGDDLNRELSQDRADAVRFYLLSKGIQSVRLSARGYGKTRPVAPNTTEDGKAQNRRVEFVIVGR